MVRIHSPRPFICNNFKDLKALRQLRGQAPIPNLPKNIAFARGRFACGMPRSMPPSNLRHRLANGFPLQIKVPARWEQRSHTTLG